MLKTLKYWFYVIQTCLGVVKQKALNHFTLGKQTMKLTTFEMGTFVLSLFMNVNILLFHKLYFYCFGNQIVFFREKTKEKDRKFLQGVRTNKRFMLQMQMRQNQL